MSLLGRSWPLGNRRFCVLWTSQHVPVKHSPMHELPHTFKHTRCKFAHHSQTERQHRKYPQVEGTVMSVDIKPLWANWILLSSLNYNWIWFLTFPNLIAKHKCRGMAWHVPCTKSGANLGLWERQGAVPNKRRLMCSLRDCLQDSPLSFSAAPCCPKTATIFRKKKGEAGRSKVPPAQWFSSRIDVTAPEVVLSPSVREGLSVFLLQRLQLAPLSCSPPSSMEQEPQGGALLLHKHERRQGPSFDVPYSSWHPLQKKMA